MTLTLPGLAGVQLDSDQERAVAHREGPCLVIAGPGSGKTRVIVERFAALVREGVGPHEQLVLTYTVKAAEEMRRRAEVALEGGFGHEVPLGNYHSFARRVLREWGWLIGVPPGFRVADDAEQWLHLEAVVTDLKPPTLWNPLRPHELLDPLLRLIGHAKQELVTPQAYGEYAEGRLRDSNDAVEISMLRRHQEVASVYTALDERYRRLGVLDHDDCILKAEHLLREHAPVRSSILQRIRYVMVDEYQDTNFAQARMVETLVADHGNIFVVADDDQAIYKFRGASLANLDRFTRMYPEHASVVLNNNYRSTLQIVDSAQAIMSVADPQTRIAKTLQSQRGPGARVEHWEAGDERAEVMGIAQDCAQQIAGGMQASDIAWLFRRHSDMVAAIQALRDCDVPYHVQGGRGFFQTREVKDLFALLEAIRDPHNSQALLRCLSLPRFQVSNLGRLALVNADRNDDESLFTLLTGSRIEDLSDEDTIAVQSCLDSLLELHGTVEREDCRDIFTAALDLSDFVGMLEQQSPSDRAQSGANLNKFYSLLDDFADWSDDRRLATALRYLNVLRDSRAADELAPIDRLEAGVNLMTAHAAKGLEWPTVFISGCVERRWAGTGGRNRDTLTLPDALVPEPAPEGDGVLDEERRLFYVAVTRARDRLVLSRAQRYPRSFSEDRPTPFMEPLQLLRDTAQEVTLEASADVPRRSSRAIADPGTQPMRLSVSDLAAFKFCPRRFEYRKRYHMPSPTTVQSWYGTLIHGVLQSLAMRRSIGEQVDSALAREVWESAWKESRGPKGGSAELRELGATQLSTYLQTPGWNDAEIQAVEHGFELPVTTGRVTGRFDRIDKREDGIPTVVDYKTGPPKTEEQAGKDLQVRAYAVALSQMERTDTVAVELHFLQTAEVARVMFDRKFLDRGYGHVKASASEVAGAWATGTFPPKPSPWSCQRCEFRTVCDEGRAATS